jgi:hypothetical protein
MTIVRPALPQPFPCLRIVWRALASPAALHPPST